MPQTVSQMMAPLHLTFCLFPWPSAVPPQGSTVTLNEWAAALKEEHMVCVIPCTADNAPSPVIPQDWKLSPHICPVLL